MAYQTLSKLPRKYTDEPSALVEEITKYFNVEKTGTNPYHYTVELPIPATDENI